MAEIKENETTETLSSQSLPPEFLTGRKLDYAVNLIKDNPLDETNQNIIKQFQDDYPELKTIFPRTALKSCRIYLKKRKMKEIEDLRIIKKMEKRM